eukprot:SAG31_NODE_66_length_28567_cov_30.222698_23_plen_375_part_00
MNGPNATVEKFKAVVKDADPDRPIAMNDNGLADGTDLDIAGWSHSGTSGFAQLHVKNPSMPQLLSECCSCPSTRSYLPGLACMRGQNAPGLLPYVAGSIGVWTLNDYYGEQAKWPSTVAGYGQIDLAGFPKPAAIWYRENWLRHPNATYISSAETPSQLHARISQKLTAWQAARGAMTNLTLSVDVPSTATCTGSHVLLDGRDVALLRIATVDVSGVPTDAGAPRAGGGVNVSIKVLSGPGRLVGVGNGDLNTHQRPQGNIIETNGGLARAVIQVTLDCTSPQRMLAKSIDSDNAAAGKGLTSVEAACPDPLPDIIVQATPLLSTQSTAPTTFMPPLKSAMVRIKLSGDSGRDSVLAVARRPEPCPFNYIDDFF